MKKILRLLAVVAITSVLSIFIYSAIMGDDSEYPKGVIQTKLFSRILGEERELIIHLPRNYDSTLVYPVMYVLDGSNQDLHIAGKFDVLTTAGYSPRTIIVGIPNMSGENRKRNLTPPFMRTDNDDKDSKPGEADKFIDFMESELFPFIESSYPASQVRLISGNSRGGLFVMYSLLSKPDIFQARFCFSTPFWRQNNILVSKVDTFLNSIDTLNTFIYMSAGENETDNIKNGMSKMRTAIIENAPVGFTLYADFIPGGTHQNNAIISASIGIARWSEYYKKTNSEK